MSAFDTATPAIIPTKMVADSVVETTCPYCGVGCGVSVSSSYKRGKAVHKVSGSETHPANQGKLCVKGSSLAETLGLTSRVLQPHSGRGAERLPVSWDNALDKIAHKFQEAIDVYGRESVAFYVSGQLLTEDYYVVNKFVKGYLGTANIDTNSRLCMSSAVAGHKRAFGEDIVPGCYEDFEQADMIVLTGSNTAWCHPVLFRRIAAAKEKNPSLFIVVIDPRHTASCDIADLHLPIQSGKDVILFNALLSWLHRHSVKDDEFIKNSTVGLEEALSTAALYSDSKQVASLCGIQEQALVEFFSRFAATEKVVTLFSMGVNQSRQGTDKVNSIINCHLYTGRIGKPGMGPFSMTGQPNAMGGREVGGLSNMLAAHMELGDSAHRERVQRFWDSPHIASKPGLKAVELFEAVEAGKIRVLWIMATNPVISLPDADQVKRALEKCDFVIVSDITDKTDTAAYADVLLPALGWGEKNGTVTNSERCISRQRPFLPEPSEARPDWWAVKEVAARLGFKKDFDYQHPSHVFREHAALSAFENSTSYESGARLFNLSGFTELDEEEYNSLTPQQWPIVEDLSLAKRIFSDGKFCYKDKKARFIPVNYIEPKFSVDKEYPLVLNTGRIRDQWHTMTRTGLAPTLGGHTPEPFIDIHPYDALLAGIREHDLARISSQWGSVIARVVCSGSQRRGQVFVPIHWTGQTASDARVGALVNPVVDAVSGEPEFKHTPVRIEPFFVRWQGLAFSRTALALKSANWWTRIQTQEAFRYELAGRKRLANAGDHAKKLLMEDDEALVQLLSQHQADWLEYSDEGSGIYHAAVIVENRLQACIYIAPRDLLPDREWMASLFVKARLSARDRMALLAGSPLGSNNDAGPTVCSCFRVGRNTILTAIKEKGLKNAQEVTACLKAGGNCGSCLPEIRALLASSSI